MIKISYDRTTNTTGVQVDDLTPINHPVKVVFKNFVSGEIHNSVDLNSNTWCTWSGAELITDVLFYNSKGSFIYEHKCDVVRDGDEIEKSLWFYHKNRKQQGLQSNGLVIGSHDGRNGHWIYSVKNNLTDVLLIDGSEKQFGKLFENYCGLPNVRMMNKIVTVEGGNITWFQGGEGYTDTVVSELIHSWLPEEEIFKVEKESISFKELIKENNFDWIHLDVEGIDGDLILSLEKLPNVIVYESMNLGEDMDSKLDEFFTLNGYTTLVCNGNTMVTKINQLV